MASKFQTNTATVIKIDEELGIIFGWAMVSTKSGSEVVDGDNESHTEKCMLFASADFMEKAGGVGGVMHERDEDGKPVEKGRVLFAFPMTSDIAKSLGIETDKTGLLIGFKPHDPEILKAAKDGTFGGFSIGGKILDFEEEEA